MLLRAKFSNMEIMDDPDKHGTGGLVQKSAFVDLRENRDMTWRQQNIGNSLAKSAIKGRREVRQ